MVRETEDVEIPAGVSRRCGETLSNAGEEIAEKPSETPNNHFPKSQHYEHLSPHCIVLTTTEESFPNIRLPCSSFHGCT